MRADGDQLKDITRLVEAGAIQPVVDKVFPFESTNEAMAYVEAGGAKGKVVVTVVTKSDTSDGLRELEMLWHIGLGTAMLLGVMFVPGIQDRDMDASPESLALLAVILGGTGCVLTGGTTLRRLRKRQMKDAALPVAKK